MKTTFTFGKWGYMLAFLCSFFVYSSTKAQKSPQAKCAGFTAMISNGSVINLCSGTSVMLSSQPNVAGYTYQWQVQTTSGGPFVNISGAVNPAYSASALGAYRVFISTGSCTDTSGITSLLRIAPQGGKITATTTKTICPGDPGGKINGTQVPGADLGIITYSWEKNENNTGWTTIPSAANNSYIAGAILKTTLFRRVSNDNCGNKAYSNTVTLATTPDLLPGAVTPLTQTITAGSTPAAITSATAASGGSGNFTYQWQSSLYERGPFSDIAGATAATYSPGALVQTTYFKRLVKDSRCLNVSEAPLAVVMVSNGILNAGTFTIYSSCVFPGATPSPLQTAYMPTGGVAPYTVQWQSSSDNTNWSDIAGANGTIYQPGVLTQNTWFRKKVTDAAGTVAYSNAESIAVVQSVLTPGTIKATSNVACLGSNPAEIKSVTSPSDYAERLSFQWQYMNSTTGGWKDIAGQIRESLIPDPIAEKTSFRRLAKDMCGTNTRSVASNEVEIDIRPALLAGDIAPTSQMVRIGITPKQLTSVTAPSGGTGSYSLSWENADLAVGPWTTVPSATGLNYQPPTVTQSEYYRRVVMDKNCLATKYTYTVEIYLNANPPVKPGTLAGSQCVFPNNKPGSISTGTPVTDGTPPYTFSWETRPGTSGTWTVISGATAETYQPPVITETRQYRRKVTDTWGEFAYTDAFTIEYHSAALNAGTIAIKTSSVVCSGSTPGLIESVAPYSGYGETPTYQWQMKFENGTWTNIPGANGESYQPGSLTQKTYFRRAAMDMCGGVSRTSYSNEVVFLLSLKLDLKSGLVDGPFITCSGTAPGIIKSVLDACGGGSPLHYQWEVMQGGAWTAIAGATSASYSPGAISANTTYRRKVSDDCGNMGYSNAVEIFVYPAIEPGIIGTDQTVCTNQKPAKISLLTNCHYTDGTVSYQWQSSTSANGPWSNISGETMNELQPATAAANMFYRLMVKSTTCSFVAYTNVASVTVNPGCRVSSPSLPREALSGDMKVYPNPLTGNSIQVKVETKGSVNVILMNAEGRAIPVSVSQTGSGLMKVSFIKNPSKGMYLLSVSDEKNNWTKKVLVQ